MARSNENCGPKDEKAVNRFQAGDVDQARNALKCFYANVRSIIDTEKSIEFGLYVHVDKEEPDILGLTETRAKEEIGDSELAQNG